MAFLWPPATTTIATIMIATIITTETDTTAMILIAAITIGIRAGRSPNQDATRGATIFAQGRDSSGIFGVLVRLALIIPYSR